MPDDAQKIAEKSAQTLWDADNASQNLGMKIEKITAGEAVLTMEVKPEYCNGHSTCHGGFSFTLADSAFAFACNSYNARCVGQHNMVSYVRPAFAGDRLTAHATEIHRGKTSGIYNITVKNQNDKIILEMRGFSHCIGTPLY